ncbi:MAG: lycopene cyclase family protein, partial [Actinomycetota bacterium]
MRRRPAVDAVVVGAGLSGLSLMLHLLRRPTGVRRIVLVDPAPLHPSDAAWAGWSARPRLVDEITARSWSRVAVH